MIGRPPRVRAGADRWLVSYADLVTLLLAFFATAYAVSDVDASKIGPAAAAIRQALGQAPRPARRANLPDAPSGLPPSTVTADLERALADDVAAGTVAVAVSGREALLSLPEAASFDSGSAVVRAEAGAVLDRFAAVVAGTAAAVRVEGHTDDVPVRTPRYSSNWELSTARAAAVVAALVERGIAPARLSAAGYGEFHPRVPNESEAARAVNRRVDIVLVVDQAGSPVAQRFQP